MKLAALPSPLVHLEPLPEVRAGGDGENTEESGVGNDGPGKSGGGELLGGGALGGGIGGPTTVGLCTKVTCAASSPKLLASAAGMPTCAARAACASSELAEPWLMTVTDASTLCTLLLVAIVVLLGNPRSATTAAESTFGAARETFDDALKDLDTTNDALACSRRLSSAATPTSSRREGAASTSHLWMTSAHT